MRVSRTGRAACRRRMCVVGLCGGVAPGGSAGQDGGGGRGSLGREWRDHRGGYRGGLLTRQHCRCNTHSRPLMFRHDYSGAPTKRTCLLSSCCCCFAVRTMATRGTRKLTRSVFWARGPRRERDQDSPEKTAFFIGCAIGLYCAIQDRVAFSANREKRSKIWLKNI